MSEACTGDLLNKQVTVGEDVMLSCGMGMDSSVWAINEQINIQAINGRLTIMCVSLPFLYVFW